MRASRPASTPKSTVREKRWIIPWRAILLRVAMVVVVVVMIGVGFSVIQWRVLPMISAMQLERQQATMLAEAESLRKSGDLDAAEEKYVATLEKFPNLAAAQTGLETVHREQKLFATYNQAVAAEQAGDDATALKLYSSLQMDSPNYRDVGARILGIRHRGDLSELYDRAVTLKTLGLEPEAIDALFQIQALDVNFRQDEVRSMLHALNLKQGQRIVTASPAEPADVPKALDFFNAALEQKPNDPVTLTEARLAVSFIAGRDAYNAQNWVEAVSRLRTVYNERNNYLDGTVASLLYQALINLGDQLVNDDLLAAYEQYSQACNLPVAETDGVCQGQQHNPPADAYAYADLDTYACADFAASTAGYCSPTPTPRPLEMFRNRNVFSPKTRAARHWVMNPDGSTASTWGPQKLLQRQL